jgi:glucan phosphoethanolaminetransferase (alkaline phosphatase superfamily)
MSLKKAYLYLVSVISLVIWVIGAIMLLNMALKTWVFPKADQDFYSYPCFAKYNPDGSQTECSPEEEARQKSSQTKTALRKNSAMQPRLWL